MRSSALISLLFASLLAACSSSSSRIDLYDECLVANECLLGGPVDGEAVCQPLAGDLFIDRAICSYVCDFTRNPADPDQDCLVAPGSGLQGRCDFPPVTNPNDAREPVCLERCNADANCAPGFVCDPVDFDLGDGTFERDFICVPE
ncbi:MAG: hypothetical protein AAF447_24185 [Myxococcota bacterium]